MPKPSSLVEQRGPGTPIRARGEAPLAMAPDQFRAIGYALVDGIADLLASLPERRVTSGEAPGAIRSMLRHDGRLPDRGEDAGALLQETFEILAAHSLFNGHPRFFGYITSSPAPIGILGDFLASAVNANVGAWTLSPVATEVEEQTIRWIADMIGYRRECGGLLVSGGNMANFVGLLAARAAHGGPEVRRCGFAPGARPAIYASAETHTWLHKAADLFGLGTDVIRWIPTDAELRLEVAALERALAQDAAQGIPPLAIVGAAGSVSTGAIDPLREMADISRRVGAWFHVDGAYGGFAAAVPGSSAEFEAFAQADSIAVDPHKWLYAPLEAGCLLVRSPAALREAFAYHPPYYHFGVEATNFVDLGPQNSRGFRALKVWLALRHAGRDGYTRMIADDIRLSRRLFEVVEGEHELEAVTQGLSIATFRYVPLDLKAAAASSRVESYLNALNEAVLEAIQGGGAAFVSNAVVSGRFLLRACIVNFNTTDEDVDALPSIVVNLGRELDRRMRPPDLRAS